MGYTLLELLIVLAVLAALAALVLPAIRGPLDKSRLTAAAQQIQASLAKARALAIREGSAVQVRCELGGQSLLIERVPGSLLINPDGTDGMEASAEEASADLPDQAQTGTATAPGDPSDKQLLRTLTLPTGVYFEQIQSGTASISGSSLTSQDRVVDLQAGIDANADADAMATALSSWSEPILFTPEGRTENASIRIRGQRDFTIQIQLRGLTGFASYGSPERVPSLSNASALNSDSAGADEADSASSRSSRTNTASPSDSSSTRTP